MKKYLYSLIIANSLLFGNVQEDISSSDSTFLGDLLHEVTSTLDANITDKVKLETLQNYITSLEFNDTIDKDKYKFNLMGYNEKELYNYQNHLQDMIDKAIKEIEDLNVEITDTQKEVVYTMESIGESRSKETGNHVKRVAEYSKILALAYGIPEEEAELLKTASPMHDIGKVWIPDSILKKPARLTPEEFEVMKTHAELGYEMLKYSKRDILKTASIVAYEHHERWDGKGYPRGLNGENIHIYGRITAIADVFDALGSTRVYKAAWSDEEIFKLFKEERGKQFDPILVDLFFENFHKFDEIRKHLVDV